MSEKQNADPAGITRRLQGPFQFSRRSLNQALDLLPLRVPRPLDGFVYLSVLSVHVRACRRFRQVILLCEHGQADGAESLARSLFESFLSQAFLCRQSIRLGKGRRGKPFRGIALTRKFRAQLFHAFDHLREEKTYEQMAEVPMLRTFAQERLQEISSRNATTKSVIGPEWSKALKRENTCAGLGVRDFAQRLGKGALAWYRAIYARQSDQVHHSDHLRFARYEGDEATYSWFDDDSLILNALWAANIAFGLTVHELCRLLDREDEAYKADGVFDDSLPEMKRVFREAGMSV